jgi:microcystin-dependent protein
MTQQLDQFGDPLAGGHLYLIQAGTVSTPQNGFQDSALTLPWPNPIILSASGRIPQFFLADGSIKIRLTDVNGVEILVADGLIVTGASSGGGGGSPVDPTTVLQTGWMQAIYGTGVVAGFVRANGRTIGNATSSGTERANADTLALFTFLYNVDPNLVVSGGRGASPAADYAANKNIALPDWRGRTLAFLDDMGNTAAGRLTAAGFGVAATVLGAASTPTESKTILTANLPAYTPAGSIVSTVTNNANLWALTNGVVGVQGGASSFTINAQGTPAVASTFTGTAQGGTSTPISATQPTIVTTFYIKL